MSFQQFNGYGGQARRESDKVVIYLSPQQPIPDMVPYELYEHATPDIWAHRLTSIRDISFKYYKPMFERIWFIVGFLTTIILPLAVFRVIFDAMYHNFDTHPSQHFFEARAVSFGVMIGSLLLFWLPILVWKSIGRRRVNVMIGHWAQRDASTRSAGAFVPVWSVQTPSVFRSTCIVSISTPPNARPTLFHPDAYLPPFIGAPTNAPGGAPYYYPYAPGQAGIPRMSVVGGLPAYNTVIPANNNNHFEDVKA